MAEQRPDYPIFGVDTGGPSAAIVHQDRLVLVGSGVVPDLFAVSRTGVWDDFRLGVLQDAEDPTQVTPVTDFDPDETEGFVSTDADGFWLQQQSGRGNEFHALLQQEGLFVFGSLGESVVPPGPFNSRLAEVRENSWFGSERGRAPVIAGGIVVFLQAGGQDLRGIAWTEEQRKYLAPSLLDRVGDLAFQQGRDMTFRPSTGRDPDTVYVVDRSGDIGVLSIPIGGDSAPTSWSRWTLRLNDESPGVDDDGNPRPSPRDLNPREGAVRAATGPLGALTFLVERGGELALETAQPDDGVWFDQALTVEVPPRTFEQRRLDPLYAPPAVLDFLLRYPGSTCYLESEGQTKLLELNPEEKERIILPPPGGAFRPRGGGRNKRIYSPNGSLREVDTKEERYIGGGRIICMAPVCFIIETLPFVEVSESGIQRSLRRVRVLDTALDIILDRRYANVESTAELVTLMQLEHVATRSGRRRNRLLGPPRRWVRDTDQIVRCEWSGGRGYRDRIALRFKTTRPTRLAGLNYRAYG